MDCKGGIDSRPLEQETVQTVAVFQFNQSSLSYHSRVVSAMDVDLLLLQSSRFSHEFWLPVINRIEGHTQTGRMGRISTSDWWEVKLEGQERAQFFARWIRTLGFHHLHVVALDDSTQVVSELESYEPGLIQKSLLFPQGGPKGELLERSVMDFCGI